MPLGAPCFPPHPWTGRLAPTSHPGLPAAWAAGSSQRGAPCACDCKPSTDCNTGPLPLNNHHVRGSSRGCGLIQRSVQFLWPERAFYMTLWQTSLLEHPLNFSLCEEFLHAANTTHKYPPMSTARCSFTQECGARQRKQTNMSKTKNGNKWLQNKELWDCSLCVLRF